MSNEREVKAILTGTNINRRGERRFWNRVHYFKYRKATDGSTMLYVREGNTTKQLNLSTFTGNILTSERSIVYEAGKKVSEIPNL